MSDLDKFLEHISEKPWSDYTAADYTIQQWHAACLIHMHTGSPTSKNQCKLPVKTPGGSVNRNGVHAAAAALAGARGGVDATDDQKEKARKSLSRLYSMMGEDMPSSIMQDSLLNEFLEHYGVKGMRWGTRRPVGPDGRVKGASSKKTSADYRKSRELQKKGAPALSNKQLKAVNERMNLEQNFNRMNPSKVQKGHNAVKGVLATAATVNAAIAFANSPAGKAVAKSFSKKKG